MTNTVDNQTNINEYLIEIRYKANPRVLDYRGVIAEDVKQILKFNHWHISPNRVDITDDKEFASNEFHNQAFISHINFGYTSRNCSTPQQFTDNAIKFFRYLFDKSWFGQSIYVNRLGVRSRIAFPTRINFEELLSLYSSRIITVSDSVNKLLSAEIIDIASPLVLKTNLGKVNFNGGPMAKKQLSEFFSFSKNFPDVSLFLDFDYWVLPEENIPERTLLSQVKDFINENSKNIENIRSLILD